MCYHCNWLWRQGCWCPKVCFKLHIRWTIAYELCLVRSMWLPRKLAPMNSQRLPSLQDQCLFILYISVFLSWDTNCHFLFFKEVKSEPLPSSTQMMKMLLSWSKCSYSLFPCELHIEAWFSPVHDSSKKAHIKELSTPSKMVKITGRQLVFDKAVYV